MSKKLLDDFVLTISDNEELSNDVETDSSSESSLTAGKKRKRDSNVNEAPKKRSKKGRALEAKELGPISEDEDTEGSSHEAQDGMFDPDFEIDLGGKSLTDIVDDFDGWGNEGNKQFDIKKAVDLDDIIARRVVQKNRSAAPNLAISGSEESSQSSESDDEKDEELSDGDAAGKDSILDFEDEELLAEDVFGGQAGSGVEDENEDEDIDSRSNHNDHDTAASDDDSVATPTAHPDDSDTRSDDDTSSQTSRSSINSTEAAKRAAFFAAEERPLLKSDRATSSTSSFLQFSLSRPLLRALTDLLFTQPTPIQQRTIPIALQGLDIVGSAKTGSGKTAAFLLPILERLLYRPSKVPVTRVAILMPTRELAVQCYSVATTLARYTDITFAQVVGGFSLREQENVLKKRPDVVIATPGRFIDHMRNSSAFQVENIEILVLDEADRMLEDGFADELDEILKTIPRGRQTMLFSATMTDTVDKLVRVGMDKPVRVSVDAKKSTVEGLVQEFVRLRPGRVEMRLATLCVLCQTIFTKRTIVFFRQKKEAHRVRIVFGLLGIKAGELHGSMTQEQRITAVNSFRDGKTTHLLATDLASRGLDIKNVLSVINFEAPQSHEIYLHRVGRTARAGKSGRSCTIAAEPDRKVVKAAVKAARSQGAKIVSRSLETDEVDAMNEQIESFANEIEDILKEEKEEKALAQVETQLRRGENLVKHEDEIKSRPKRTWFESEKEKRVAKERGLAELNGVKFVGEKKKLSNKQKKQLDAKRERMEGRTIKKSKDSEKKVKAARAETRKNKKAKVKVKGKGRR